MEGGEDYIDSIIKKTQESGKLVEVHENNNVFYIVMNSGENTFNWDFVRAMESCVEEITKDRDLTGYSCVTLSTNPKIFSNGMDLINIPTAKELGELFEHSGKLLGKLVAIGMPTIALVNGHAFAAGLYLVFCHDYIVMREDKGFLCFNENQFGAPVNYYNAALCKQKIGSRNYFEMYTQFIKVNAQDGMFNSLINILFTNHLYSTKKRHNS